MFRFSEFLNATDIIALSPNDEYAAYEYVGLLNSYGENNMDVELPLKAFTFFSPPKPADGVTFSFLQKHAILSKISYCGIETINAWTCKLCGPSGIELVSTFHSPDDELQGYVGFDHSDKSIVISFRGSSNTQNWISNVLIYKTKMEGVPPDARVHLGFLQEWTRQGIKTEVISLIQRAINQQPNYKLTFVGHSLGGAVATIAALDVAFTLKIDYSKMRLMTQGMPRIGNRALAKYISVLNWNFLDRAVNNRDVVPHVPPRALEFLHYDKVHWLNSEGALFECNINSGTEEDNCANTFYLYSTDDHTLIKYFGIEFLPNHTC